ncbi:hypothetical protein [Natronoglycomyces albus]|uniref:Uncharacterized protein n=1 Tax=Natronoglycomyces albus TaxID=2811108 RepID=A0A895XMG7_9ACTN|nr:hypothetical protein [Natronoglycomyces albus]QSB04195.1 hypothetical protein JQS30_10260 [Natronoglycomyces albus]
MLVECISSDEVREWVDDKGDIHRNVHHLQQISVGTRYEVHGIVMGGDRIAYLVAGDKDDTDPNVYPMMIQDKNFVIVDPAIPADWYSWRGRILCYFCGENCDCGANPPVQFCIGYKEFALSLRHGIGLSERNPDDLLIFYKVIHGIREK